MATSMPSIIGTNSGHGHAWERPDGVKAKCGGPGICPECSRDLIYVQRENEKAEASSVNVYAEPMAGLYIGCMVHYRRLGGGCQVALVLRIWNQNTGYIEAGIFSLNVADPHDNYVPVNVTSCSLNHGDGSEQWHWIEEHDKS